MIPPPIQEERGFAVEAEGDWEERRNTAWISSGVAVWW